MDIVKIWFDGACPLCAREIALMRRLDWRDRIMFIDLGDEATHCPIDRETLLSRFHALEQGKLLSGAAAFAAMWRVIPLLRPLGLLARNRMVLRGLEWLYIRFLSVRPSVQRAFASKR
jgi:predicted DCC family thiol-disulfide oxidoreductase YuxK